MTEWFYARGGQQNGPVTFEQLLVLADNGGLDATMDQVWNASMTGWTPAGQVLGLFKLPPVSESSAAAGSNPYAAPQSSWAGSFGSAGVALTEILPGSSLIDPMDIFSRSYEIFRRQFGTILLVGLVYLACVMAVSFGITFIDILYSVMSTPDGGPPENPSLIRIVILVFAQLVQHSVSIFLQLGLVRVGLNLISGKEASIGMLFGEGSKLLRALGASILLGIAIVIGLVLLIVPGIYIALRYGQCISAIVDRDLGVFDAFSYSSSITTNNLMNLFLLALLSLVAIIIAIIPCGLGLIIVGPMVWLSGLIAYRWLQYGPDVAKDHPGTETPMLSGM